jgi:hypothetical protein
VLFRCYPSPWQVWQETPDESYILVAELPQKPSGEALDRILLGEPSIDSSAAETNPVVRPRQRGGFLTELQSFIRALTQ